MHSIWSRVFHDIAWDSVGANVSATSKKLTDAARQNLIIFSAICAMGGGLSAAVGLLGSYAPRVNFCDPKTNPCTKVEMDANADRPINIDVLYIPGFGLQRTVASVLSVIFFGGGLMAIAKAEEEQEEIEPELQLKQQVKIKQLELDANTELANFENLARTRVEVHEQELKESVAEMFFERNPEAIAQYLPKPEPIAPEIKNEPPQIVEKVIEPEPEPEPDPLFFGVELPENPQLEVEFWDWEWFNNRADDLPHIRVIAPTNGGKTTLCDWLVDVVPSEQRKVITVKRKPHQWVGLPVYGVPFQYDVVRDHLEKLDSEMVERTRLMEKGEYRGKLSAIVDEWKAISRRVKAIKDEETKQIISPSAKEIMGDLLTLAREPGIRIFALAQGRQVITWGLEGESDILECFCTVYLGKFAVEEALALQRGYAKNSDEFGIWSKVIDFLKAQGKRAAWVETEFGKFPAIAPDLSKWRREVLKPEISGIEVQQEVEAIDTSCPMPPAQPDNDISPDELLLMNLDRIVAGFENSLVRSVDLRESGNKGRSHPEVDELEERDEPAQSKPTIQPAAQETAPAPPEKRYTPLQLTRLELIPIVAEMKSREMSQTKIVEQLWQCKKSAAGWSKAYREFRNLGL
jgi:hypothetical protein